MSFAIIEKVNKLSMKKKVVDVRSGDTVRVHQKIKEGKGDFGFNARTEVYENLFKAGVIDPTKVSRVALENAASIAGMLLTTECVVAEKPKKDEPMHGGGAPDMGGMGY